MGQDIANYLTTMDTFFGEDVRGVGLLRPPLIAFPLKLFTLTFGDLNGAKVLGVLVSVSIGVPFFLIAKRLCQVWIAVAVSLMFVCTAAYADMLAWGYLTMIAIFFILLSLHFFLLVLEKPSRKDMVLAGLFASLIVGFNQLSLVFFVLLFSVFVVAWVLFNRQAALENGKPMAGAIAIGIVLSLPYLPIYLRLMQVQPMGSGELSSSNVSLAQIEEALVGFGWYWGIVSALSIVSVIALLWLWRYDRNRALLLAVMLLLPLLLLVFSLPPPFVELNRRAHFFLYIPLWLLAGVFLSRGWSWQGYRSGKLPHLVRRVAVVALILALLPTAVAFSQEQLNGGLDYYGYLDDARWQAVRWIGENAGPGATLVVYPSQLGWWIEAEAMKNTFYLEDREASPTIFEEDRSLIADRILSRNQGLENGNLRLATAYPYANAPGSPVVSVYVGGFYQEVLSFDDQRNRLSIGADSVSLADASGDMAVEVDDDSGRMRRSYQIGDCEISQTAILRSGEYKADICYQIECHGAAEAVGLEIPLLFSYQPTAMSILGKDSFEVTQVFHTALQGNVPVTATVTVVADGATVELGSLSGQGVVFLFNNIQKGAFIGFYIDITTTPQQERNTPTVHYIVPDLIMNNSISFLIVDLAPGSSWLNRVTEEAEKWFADCPYYDLVYSRGDVRIYQVDTSAMT